MLILKCRVGLVTLLAVCASLPAQVVSHADAFQDLSRAHGFCVGQRLSVQWMRESRPELDAKLSEADALFWAIYGPSDTAMTERLRAVLKSDYDTYDTQLRAGLLKPRPAGYSLDDAQAGIALLKKRTEGDIESPVLETLLIYHPENQRNAAWEFVHNFKRKLRTKPALSTVDLDIQLECPTSWHQVPMDPPSVGIKLVSECGRGLDICMLTVKSLPVGASVSQSEIDALGTADGIKNMMLPPNARLLSATPISLDGEKGGMLVCDQEQQRVDVVITLRMQYYAVFFRRNLVTLQAFVGVEGRDQGQLEKSYKRCETLFRLIANSVTFMDKRK